MKLFRPIALVMLMFGLTTVVVAQDLDLPEPPDKVFRTEGGEEVRQYLLTVMAVGRRHITVEFTDGTRHTYRVPDDFRFNIDGTPTPLSGIYPRQSLRAYLHYVNGEWVLAQPTEFVEAEETPVVIASTADRASEEDLQPRESAPAPAMPSTAGSLPLMAVVGMLLLAFAGALRVVRIGRD